MITSNLQPFREQLDTFTTAGEYQECIRYEAEYMDSPDAPREVGATLEAIDTYRTVSVKAHMGVGKTTLLCGMLRQLWDKDNTTKVLVLSSRRSLSATLYSSIMTRMAGTTCDVKLYLDVMDDSRAMHSADILVISPESLVRLNDGDVFSFNADTVVIDEYSSFNFHVSQSDTLRNRRRDVMAIYEFLMHDAVRVWTLDADHDDGCTKLLRRWRGMDDSLLIWNTKTKNPFKYYVHDFDEDEQPVITQLRANIRAGKKCYVVSDGKRHSDRVKKRIEFDDDDGAKVLFDALGVEGKKGLLINSESNNRDFNKFKDVEGWWSEYDYVVVSPTVSYGTSFDPAVPHFDCIYGFFSGKSVLAQTACQMLHRVRKLAGKEQKVVLCVSGKTRFCGDELKAVIHLPCQ